MKLVPVQALVAAWQRRELIARLARKELSARLRGSILGWAWLAAAPLVMLGAYTLVFTNVLKVGPAAGRADAGAYPLFIFMGLILFQMFADLALRGPNLLLENVSYIKKVVFPVEILAWVALARALVAAAVSMTILCLFFLVMRGAPPITAIFLPLLFAMYCLFLLGIVWLLSVIGVFARDLSHFMASVVPILMFVSPIFYSVADIPSPIQPLAYLNPITVFIECARYIMFDGALPPWPQLLAVLIGPIAVFWLGYSVFMRNRSRFADVV